MSNLPEDLKKILGPSEQVELYITQKIYHPKINIDSVVITNQRIILRHPHMLGIKKDYTDFNYQDIANVVLDKGILRSTIRCTLRLEGEPLSLSDLPNSDAQKAYGVIRQNVIRFQAPLAAGYAGLPPYQQASQVGVPVASGTCSKCGAGLSAGQKFCGTCGAPV